MKNLSSINYTSNLCGWTKILIWIKCHFQFPGKIRPNLTKSSQICQSVLPNPLWWGKKKKNILERSYSRLIFHTSRSTLWKKFPVCLQSSMKTEPKHFRAILMRSLALKNLQSHCFHSQDTSRIKTREARRESHLQETWSMKGFLADIHASVS